MEMLLSPELDGDAKLNALSMIKEFYFKSGGFDKNSYQNVTDVSDFVYQFHKSNMTQFTNFYFSSILMETLWPLWMSSWSIDW